MAVTTCDLYEGAYYLLNDCELEAIEGLKLGGELTCRMSFSGPEIEALQLVYLQGRPVANLFAFRRAYGQLSSLILRARKKFKNQLKQEAQERAGERS